MKNNSKNGVSDAIVVEEIPSDSTKGETAMVISKQSVNPHMLADRLRKIHEVQKLTDKRARLVSDMDNISNFEEGLTGEDEQITLTNDSGEIEVKKEGAVRELVSVLKGNVSRSLAQVDSDLLAATI